MQKQVQFLVFPAAYSIRPKNQAVQVCLKKLQHIQEK